ncbi:MAG TPA: dipeptide epimerase [Albidovulum sp.]|uniref:N-acetyl-D-Glu racemase DgcA n=1 Tax=Albidovulum sp. TaxID=1872424 RepID=UPI002B581B07|nr:dipeptide epimerase [Albidovulum sp.]
MTLSVTTETFPLAETFTISRGSKTEAHVLTATIRRDGAEGRGECVPYARYGESLESVAAAVSALPGDITRSALQAALAPGAARNAVDCALWDHEAMVAGRPVWQIAGLARPAPVVTAYTLSLDTPERMRAAAARQAHRPILKIKLGTAEDMARLEAVRAGAPKPTIIVDANEGWTAEVYADLAPHLTRLGVALVEQPLPAGADEALAEIARPVPVCADEAAHDRRSLQALRRKYDVVNIKLDKTGGLTEALAMRDAARAEGFGIMVGCMVGSSLAMAPAFLVAQGADFVDLDAPMLLAADRAHPVRYLGSQMQVPDAALWGQGFARAAGDPGGGAAPTPPGYL